MRISDWSSDVCSSDLAGGADAALDVLDVDGPAQLLLGERADLADDPVGTATGTPGNDHPDVLGRIVLGGGAVGRAEARARGGGSDSQQAGHGQNGRASWREGGGEYGSGR